METISIREAAERLGVSGKVVRRLIAQGTLRAEKVRGNHGEEWRVEAASLSAAGSPESPRSLASPPASSVSTSASLGAAPSPAPRDAVLDERAEMLRDKAFLQRQVENLTALLGHSLAARSTPPAPSHPDEAIPIVDTEPDKVAKPYPSLPAVTEALQSSLRLVEVEDVAVIEMCSVRVLWGRPVLWRLLASEEADRSALRDAILSPDAAWDPPGEEVAFLFMRDLDGAAVWGCACGPRWFGPPFEEALRTARVARA